MTARKRKSKKRSAANSKQPEPHVFFIDEALGRHHISDALKHAGEIVEVHNDIFPSGTQDINWIEYVGKNRRLAITKDKRIRHRSAEIQAIKDHCAMIFRFASGNLRGKEMAEIVIKARERIKRYADKNGGPCIVSLTSDGKLSPIDIN